MRLELPDMGHFVRVNQLRPVTDPIFLSADGSPTPSGLFSSEIFGRPGSEERRRRWAFVDLGGRFLHPLVYKTLCQLDRKFPLVVSGERRVLRVAGSGVMEAAEEGSPEGWTGIDGLWERWPDIRWGTGAETGQRAERLGLLAAVPRERAFIDAWPVMPALFRDADVTPGAGGAREIPPVNYLYVRLLTSAPAIASGLDFADGARKLRAQETLLEIHKSCLDLIASKRGMIQDRVLGKHADWAVQTVISGPTPAKAERPGDQEVPFGTVGVPLYLVVNLFQPFVLRSLSERLFRLSQGQERVLLGGKYFELPPEARAQLGPDLYRKWISRFMRSQADRLAPPSVTAKSGREIAIPLYDAELGRPTTLADLFYITTSVVVADKHVMWTRYPVEDFRACHFARVAILTTERTEERLIGEARYPRYPVLTEPITWVDSTRIPAVATPAAGADFDGDRIRLFGLFTQEANIRAAELIRSPTNICDGQGGPSRKVSNEAVLTLFSLTR